MPAIQLSDYDYPLETDRIAQEPALKRDQARLMVLDRREGRRFHRRFFEMADYLRSGDVLVLNDTRVVPARLRARKTTGAELELLLLRDLGRGRWEALIRGKVSPGLPVILENGTEVMVEGADPAGKRVIQFPDGQDPLRIMQGVGRIPLPPYIHRNGDARSAVMDRERYQTVYAKHPGAVAAPTAGLHFSEAVFSNLRAKGVSTVFLTLHVGYGTFKPVVEKDIRRHRMDKEYYSISRETARAVNDALLDGRRVIAVGTTSTRALEAAAEGTGRIVRLEGETDLFIYPGYRFRVTQGLVTNFHLPRSTLLMLASAFAGKEMIDRAYRDAREMGYRFYSYGDAMLIL